MLLGRRAVEPDLGRWDLPGGFLEEGEEPLTGLRRELREETGLEVEPLSFLGAWIDRYGDGGRNRDAQPLLACPGRRRAQAADDVAELRWFGATSCRRRSELAFRVNATVLEAWQRAAAPPAPKPS